VTSAPRAQRRADALVELARGAIAGGGLPTVGGVRPHLGILITPQTLLGSAGTNHNQNHAAGSGHDGDNASGDGVGDEGEDGGRSQGSAGHGDGFARSDPLARAGIPPLPERPWLNWIGQVQAELAQRLACDAIVWRIVLDPATGLPLDVGREHRIVPHGSARPYTPAIGPVDGPAATHRPSGPTSITRCPGTSAARQTLNISYLCAAGTMD
jgi:hypothetical protein